MQFSFESLNEDGTLIQHSFTAQRWTEALHQFVKFLRGSGYSLDDNSIGVNTMLHMYGNENDLCYITEFEQEAI